MRGGRFLVVGALVLVAMVCSPTAAHAWTPGTHVFLGETVLANLEQLPYTVASLLRAFPYDFLYGNIAADTSIAKKYAPVGRHCHSWHVGQEIYDLADTESLRAFALGYLAHLAADTVAHNYFVPRQLVVTSSTIAIGHSYWESRFETHLGEPYARTAVDIIRLGHDSADSHLDRILSPTIFSVRTSRRLFKGMVGITETQSWQRAFRVVAEASRWDLSDERVERHMGMAFQYIMEVLFASNGSSARRLDPSGHDSLRLAKRMRLDVLKSLVSPPIEELASMADDHFGVPQEEFPYWEGSAAQRPWRNR